MKINYELTLLDDQQMKQILGGNGGGCTASQACKDGSTISCSGSGTPPGGEDPCQTVTGQAMNAVTCYSASTGWQSSWCLGAQAPAQSTFEPPV